MEPGTYGAVVCKNTVQGIAVAEHKYGACLKGTGELCDVCEVIADENCTEPSAFLECDPRGAIVEYRVVFHVTDRTRLVNGLPRTRAVWLIKGYTDLESVPNILSIRLDVPADRIKVTEVTRIRVVQ